MNVLAESKDTELFLSWCEKSKAIEKQIMEAQRALIKFGDELKETSTDDSLLIEAKDWFIKDNINMSGQLLYAVDMIGACGSVRHDIWGILGYLQRARLTTSSVLRQIHRGIFYAPRSFARQQPSISRNAQDES